MEARDLAKVEAGVRFSLPALQNHETITPRLGLSRPWCDVRISRRVHPRGDRCTMNTSLAFHLHFYAPRRFDGNGAARAAGNDHGKDVCYRDIERWRVSRYGECTCVARRSYEDRRRSGPMADCEWTDIACFALNNRC